MILHRNADTQTVQARLDNDEFTEIYDCSFSACNNPSCLCSTLELMLTPLPSVFNGNTDPMRMVIDLKNRKTGASEIRELTYDETILSDAFIGLLDDDDFEILISEFKKYKRNISETTDISDLDILFDFDHMENSETMLAYNDLLPYGDDLRLDMDGHGWVILDQHCMKPKCTCSNVYLEFNRLNPDKGFDDVYFVLSMNYKNKTWDGYEHMMNAPWPLERIQETLETLYPDFYDMLKNRHAKLKALYSQSKRRHDKPKNGPAGKPGRNDMCPCGSGKKFKKCCMP